MTLNGSVKEKLLKGVELNGRPHRNPIDGYNMLDSFSGKVKDSPHKDFIYVNDGGPIGAMRDDDWKVVFMPRPGAHPPLRIPFCREMMTVQRRRR